LTPPPPRPELAAVLVVVIAAVGEQPLCSLARPADLSAHRLEPVHEREQLGDVVAVRAGDRHRERDAAGVGQEVVLGARAATIDRGRAGPAPPCRART
jgi:hypothetical protein